MVQCSFHHLLRSCIELPWQRKINDTPIMIFFYLFDTVKENLYNLYMGRLKRLWYFLSSVNSFFKRACAAIQWGKMSDFWLDSSSTSILHVCKQQRLWRVCECAGSPEPSLIAYVISTIITWAGSYFLSLFYTYNKYFNIQHTQRQNISQIGYYICIIFL